MSGILEGITPEAIKQFLNMTPRKLKEVGLTREQVEELARQNGVRIKTTAIKYTKAPLLARKLMKDEYAEAYKAKEEGRPIAYLMAGVDALICKAMGIVPLFTENFAGNVTAMKGDVPMFDRAERDGFSSEICGYARIGLGMCSCRCEGIDPHDLPAGGLPDPDILLSTGMDCDTRFKWYDSMKYYYPDVPVFSCDMSYAFMPPYMDFDDKALKKAYIDYEVEQKHRMVSFLEKTTGLKMDWEKYRQMVAYQREAEALLYESNRLREKGKCVMPAEDNFGCINPMLFNPGEESTRDYYKALLEEVKELQKQEIYVLDEEKFRITWAMGLPIWHQMNLFDYIISKGGVVVNEATYQPFTTYEKIKVDTDDPIREDVTRMWEKNWEVYRDAKSKRLGVNNWFVSQLLENGRSDGIICHSLKSCRAMTVGQIQQINVLKDTFNLPTYVIEGDMADSRAFNLEQSKASIDAWFETMAARKARG